MCLVYDGLNVLSNEHTLCTINVCLVYDGLNVLSNEHTLCTINVIGHVHMYVCNLLDLLKAR